MSIGAPVLVTILAMGFWVAALVKFDLEALLASFAASIVAATLWLVLLFQ